MRFSRSPARTASRRRRSLVACLFLLLPATIPAAAELAVTHGVASGDVTATSAIVWARSNVPARLVVEIGEGPERRRFRASSTPAEDLTAQVLVDGLEPATRYRYRVHFERERESESEGENTGPRVSAVAAGSFITAPAAGTPAPVRFVVGGDVGGQTYCRHAEEGYRIFAAMAALEPDFLIANGDMIYADGRCPEYGSRGWRNVPGEFPAIDDPEVDWHDLDQVREVILAHWRYNRADRHHQAFLARVPIYAQWDDHEVINDFGARWQTWSEDTGREGYPNLVRAGREALFAWNPIGRRAAPGAIHGAFRWGRDVEVFLLDARSYRDLNDLPDRPEHAKTLLGAEQFDWLVRGLERSDATWKIVSSDVPLSVPTGSDAELFGRDGWANGDAADFSSRTGFEGELRRLLERLDAADVANVVFVVTDVHFAMTLRYAVDVDGDGDELRFHELLSGPLNAVRAPTPPKLDPTFRPVILYAEGGIFNFGFVRVERRGEDVVLVADVRGADGVPRFGSRLELRAEK